VPGCGASSANTRVELGNGGRGKSERDVLGPVAQSMDNQLALAEAPQTPAARGEVPPGRQGHSAKPPQAIGEATRLAVRNVRKGT
jgi:hypothetical protein